MRRIIRTWKLGLVLINAILVCRAQDDTINFIDELPSENYGLTAYGEPCSDDCKPRGFPYTWCHKLPSRNGTWVDRDYCSPSPGVTRYLEPCLDTCSQKDQIFFWCKTRPTKRGDWDYCSPSGSAASVCSWSEWEAWSECSPSCGPKSTRTRRRRFETSLGKVGPCSGEIEQSIAKCDQIKECPVAAPSSDCLWSNWGEWSACSVSCGPRSGHQSRSRNVVSSHFGNGLPCREEDAFETIVCRVEDLCDQIQEEEAFQTTERLLTTTTTSPPFLRPEEGPAEQPRSINVFKAKDVGQEKGKIKAGENLPFTVVRVSSSVSHARTSGETTTAEDETTTTTVRAFHSHPQGLPINITQTGRKISKPPFLRPLTKFPDIKIPGLDLTSSTTTTSTPKVRLSILTKQPKTGLFFNSTRTPFPTESTTQQTSPVPSTPFITTTQPNPDPEDELGGATTMQDKPVESTDPAFVSKDLIRLLSKIGPATDSTTDTTEESTSNLEDQESTTDKDNADTTVNPTVVSSTTEPPPTTTTEKLISTTESPLEEQQRSSNSSKSEEEPPASELTTLPDTTVTTAETTPFKVSDSNNPESKTTESEQIPETTPFKLPGNISTSTEFETTPATTASASSSNSTDPSTPSGRARSRFQGKNELRELFAKRRNATASGLPNTRFDILLSTPSPDETTSRRSFFANKSRSKQPFNFTPDVSSESTTASSTFTRKRPSILSRFRNNDATSTTSELPKSDPDTLTTDSPEESFDTSTLTSNRGRNRPSFLDRVRTTTTTEEPFSTPNLLVPAQTTPETTRSPVTTNQDETTQKPLSFFRTARPHSRTTRQPEVHSGVTENLAHSSGFDKTKTRVRPSKDSLITQFYPDPEYVDEDEEEDDHTLATKQTTPITTSVTVPVTTPATTRPRARVRPFVTTENPEETTEPFFVTPLPDDADSKYNPCSFADACGPNAVCESPNGVDHICTCPSGFTGIPREGFPDPAHGCVRTPERCNPANSTSCHPGTSCVHNYCLPSCAVDNECSLGERCVDEVCIKICFYDAHCLAGEYCQKTSETDGNGVCLSGCQRDTNCPFGQVCQDNKCEDGCHFNNDCTQNTACINGSCADPCVDFNECGSNAVCQVVSHAPTCSCPEGLKELNSPYDACVPDTLNLSEVECLKTSDCHDGLVCENFHCIQEI